MPGRVRVGVVRPLVSPREAAVRFRLLSRIKRSFQSWFLIGAVVSSGFTHLGRLEARRRGRPMAPAGPALPVARVFVCRLRPVTSRWNVGGWRVLRIDRFRACRDPSSDVSCAQFIACWLGARRTTIAGGADLGEGRAEPRAGLSTDRFVGSPNDREDARFGECADEAERLSVGGRIVVDSGMWALIMFRNGDGC